MSPPPVNPARKGSDEGGPSCATARVRALWPRLEPRQQQIVLDPSQFVDHRYPLTSGEVAELTRLSERQVRYWADRGLIPHWRRGRRRLFESVGLIAAFSITNASQHELQFYRGVMEEPLEKLAAKLGILSSLLASRLEDVEPSQAKALAEPLAELSRR
jgi:excisionase family DNA binding protein